MNAKDIEIGKAYEVKSPNSYGIGTKGIVLKVIEPSGSRHDHIRRYQVDLGPRKNEEDSRTENVMSSFIRGPWTADHEAKKQASDKAWARRQAAKAADNVKAILPGIENFLLSLNNLESGVLSGSERAQVDQYLAIVRGPESAEETSKS